MPRYLIERTYTVDMDGLPNVAEQRSHSDWRLGRPVHGYGQRIRAQNGDQIQHVCSDKRKWSAIQQDRVVIHLFNRPCPLAGVGVRLEFDDVGVHLGVFKRIVRSPKTTDAQCPRRLTAFDRHYQFRALLPLGIRDRKWICRTIRYPLSSQRALSKAAAGSKSNDGSEKEWLAHVSVSSR